MVITLSYLSKAFDKYNEKYFNNELTRPHFRLINTRRALGIFKSYRMTGKMELCITKVFDRTPNEFDNTIIHEMIHQYIYEMGIIDNNGHGVEWHRIAKRINKDGWNITQFGERPQTLAIKNNKEYYMLSFVDGSKRRFLCRVCPKVIDAYKNYCKEHFTDVVFFKSTKTDFDRFVNCQRHIKGQYVTNEQWEKYTLKEICHIV